MNFSILFYWWNDTSSIVHQDLNNPVIPCISLMRGLGCLAPIHVLDVSSLDSDWGNFPSLLDFEVIQKKPSFASPRKLQSKIFDCHEHFKKIDHQYLMISDTDLFWQHAPSLPSPSGKLLSNQFNTGLLYLDKESPKVNAFFDLWKAYIHAGIVSEDMRRTIMDKYCKALGGDRNAFQEESVFCYLKGHTLYEDVVEPLPAKHNQPQINQYSVDTPNFHCVRWKFKNRGLFPLVCKPLFERMELADEIYGDLSFLGGTYMPDDNMEKSFKAYQRLFSETLRKHGVPLS